METYGGPKLLNNEIYHVRYVLGMQTLLTHTLLMLETPFACKTKRKKKVIDKYIQHKYFK